MAATNNIYKFKDASDYYTPEQYCDYPPAKINDKPLTLIIDNGSFQLRAGWENENLPRLIFKSALARNRGNKKDRDWNLQVGNDIRDFEAVRWMIRTPFDMNVVVNFNAQEIIFDHVFHHLGVNTEHSVDHPVVLTEALANPSYSRNKMLELIFEGYGVPQLALGVDSLFSLYANTSNSSTALIVSSSFQVTHVIPVVNGNVDKSNCRRLNLGGYNNCAYLSRLMQLKFPKYVPLFTLTRMEEYLQTKTTITPNYEEGISKWKSAEYKQNKKTYIKDSKSEDTMCNPCEDIDKFTTIAKRLRKLEHKLYSMEHMAEIEKENPDLFYCMMESAGFETTEELNENITKYQLEYDAEHAEIVKIKNITEDPHISFEDVQAVEILFQPSMVGFEEAGLSEILENVFSCYPENVQNELAKNVFITGGNTSYPGFKERIESELMKMRPFNSLINVTMSNDVILDGWKGANKWSNANKESKNAWITKEFYEENGKEINYIVNSVFDNQLPLI